MFPWEEFSSGCGTDQHSFIPWSDHPYSWTHQQSEPSHCPTAPVSPQGDRVSGAPQKVLGTPLLGREQSACNQPRPNPGEQGSQASVSWGKSMSPFCPRAVGSNYAWTPGSFFGSFFQPYEVQLNVEYALQWKALLRLQVGIPSWGWHSEYHFEPKWDVSKSEGSGGGGRGPEPTCGWESPPAVGLEPKMLLYW